MKNIYCILMHFIDDISDDSEALFETLTNTFEEQNILKNIEDPKLIFRLISKILINHHRTSDFYYKLEKIFQYMITEVPSLISIFLSDITEQNKEIIFFLLEKKLIKPDKSFINNYLAKKFNYKENTDKLQSFYYLYPKMKDFLEDEIQKQIEEEILQKYKEDILTFEDKCKKGENDSYICSLIRLDSVEEFISYINRTNLSLSTKIKPSIYETNPFLIDKEPTLIEYAAYFGSIQIITYLKYNNVPLTFSLWLYTVHSNNPELIHFLEENDIKLNTNKSFSDNVLIESIKCHHNDISNYLKDELYDQNEFDDNFGSIITNSLNFFFFPSEVCSVICKPYNNNGFDLSQLCFSLTKITIPSSVTSIGNDAFNGCSKVEQISIPFSVIKIGDFAFCGCSSLTKISIPSSVIENGTDIFFGRSNLEQIPSFSFEASNIKDIFHGCSSKSLVELNTVIKVLERVSKEGEIENIMSDELFSSFYDSNIWTTFDIDCAMPLSSFYIANLNSILPPNNANDTNDDEKDKIYLLVRYTKDDIKKYIDYLQFEFKSYMEMRKQMDEIIVPIGYTRKSSDENGFLFAFLTTTNITLNDAIKSLPLQVKYNYAIKLIITVNKIFKGNSLSGFYITPKTILINMHNDEPSVGLIGFIGGINELKLCPTAKEFIYNTDFSPAELKRRIRPSVRSPNSKSDVYGLAKVIQFIIGNQYMIPKFENAIESALKKNPDDRILLNDFKNIMLELFPKINSFSNLVMSVELQEKPKIGLANKIKKYCILLKTKEGYPRVYKLPQVITKIHPNKKIRKIRVGPERKVIKEEITILIVGQIGSGKTTLLNGFANYLYGVEWTDNCRFKVVSDEDDGENRTAYHQAINQTEYITAYTFYWQPGFAVPYTVTLIDTPGVCDQRFMFDKQFIDDLESFFTFENGIDQLNAVAFTVQSSNSKLNYCVKYLYDRISHLFGANNFIITATFSDAYKPSVIEALKFHEIPTDYVSEFNNSAIFAMRGGHDRIITKKFWDICQTGYANIFEYVNKMNPTSLVLPQIALANRKEIIISIEVLNQKICEEIVKMNLIEQECKIIKQNETKINSSTNFTYTVTDVQYVEEKLKPNDFATYCTKCNKTCHYPCCECFSDDDTLKKCFVMDCNGCCTFCGCNWTEHQKKRFKLVAIKVNETRKYEILEKHFGDKESKKQSSQKMLENAQKEYEIIWERASNYVTSIKNCVDRLHQIVLKPIIISEVNFIRHLIELEKQNQPLMWEEKVRWFYELIEQHKIITEISQRENAIPHQISQVKNQRILNFLEELIKI